MSAPTEQSASGATGGSRREDPTTSPGPSPRRARGVVGKAKGRSPRQRRSRRAEAIDQMAQTAEPKAKPRHDTGRSARPRILAAARKLAERKGYEPLQVRDITQEVGISHQAFYGHFANKRHVVAVATSEELGSVIDLVMRGAKRDQLWAERLIADIDRALIETYPPKDGPSQRLRRRLTKAICSQGGYEALRIAELVKVSKIGHGEFYRRYGGKKGCLQRIYAEVVEEVAEEIVSSEQPDRLVAFAESIARDRRRAELLIRGASHLPEGPAPEEGVATREALSGLVGSLVVADPQLARSPGGREAVAGALLEIVRSSVLAGEMEELPERVVIFTASRSGAVEESKLIAA